MKKKFTFIFIFIFMLLNQTLAFAGQWLNVDMSNYRTWVDTSRWENHPYQAWVDTSHYEWKQYTQWVSSGYWQDASYWTGEYWIYNPAGRDTIASGTDTPPWSAWGYAYFDTSSSGSSFVNSLQTRNDQIAILYRMDSSVYAGAHASNIGYKYEKTVDIIFDYSGDPTAPRILRRSWNLWLDTQVGPWYNNDTYLYAKSSGYYRKDKTNKVTWIDTSHNETREGWVWVTSGYNEWRDNWVWVTSGYWDEAHGSVSLAKSPRYVFTKLTEQNDGDVMHMDLDLSWSMNNKVTKVSAYHDVRRYKNNGLERIYGTNLKIKGLNTPNGSGNYRFEYNHPGDPESLLYVEFTFDNGTKVRVFAKIPINGIAATEKLSAPNPVFDKSIMDADNVSF